MESNIVISLSRPQKTAGARGVTTFDRTRQAASMVQIGVDDPAVACVGTAPASAGGNPAGRRVRRTTHAQQSTRGICPHSHREESSRQQVNKDHRTADRGVRDSITRWRGSVSGFAALRDFARANDRLGSMLLKKDFEGGL